MKEVFVRAKTPSGKWVTVSLRELDEDSFRRFIGDKLAQVGIVAGIEATDEEEEPLTTRV